MNFNYETQGAITYLVCELDPADQLDNLTLGMLTNNHINGLAMVVYTEMDGHRFLKFNISAKVTVNQFFGGSMSKQRALQAFRSILNALCSADEYMIDPNCFSLNPDHVFLNVSNCETALICIPVSSEKDISTEAAALFQNLISNTRFDPQDGSDYITQMKAYLEDDANFTVYGFKDLVERIESGTAAPAQAASQAQFVPNQQSEPAVSPAPAYGSTVVMNHIPDPAGVANQPPVTQSAPVMNSQPVEQPQPPVRQPVSIQQAQPQPPVQIPAQPQVQIPAQPPVQRPVPPPAPNAKKPPVSSNPGFAIPGQTGPGFAIPGQTGGIKQSANQQTPPAGQSAQNEQGEKKMSFFGLMMHYNKENAAIYKAQKEAGKSKSKEKPAKQPKVPAQKAVPPVTMPQQGVPTGAAPVPPPANQPGFAAQQPNYAAPVPPIPVQNSFNETTVLSPLSGETTVLSELAVRSEPYLTRAKTGERVYINKPLFRVGKEKSYVDYFIADNTAISRSHCNIHTENGEYFIEDTNSTNHTFINGKIINSNEKVKLSDGDKVRLANEDFTFSV